MKVRSGFVSNSSSSSFVAVTICMGTPPGQRICRALGIADSTNWEDLENTYELIDNDQFAIIVKDSDIPLTLYFSESINYSYLGVSIDDLLEQGKTLQQCQAIAHSLTKRKAGISIPPSEFKLNYGEWGSG